MFSFKPKCEHYWEVISEARESSPIEKASKLVGRVPRIVLNDKDFYRATIIQIVTCKHCGEIKRYVTKG